MRKALLSALVALGFLAAASAHAAVNVSGNFKTGLPTPTLFIDAPFTLTVTAAGSINNVVFKDWVQDDGTQNIVGLTSPGTWSYQINNGPTLTINVGGFSDNLSGSGVNDISPGSGFLYFNGNIAVAPGQTLTFFPFAASFNAGGSNFNQPPGTFVGNVFSASVGGIRLTADTQVPEPSTWALLVAGAVGLSVVALRRCCCRYAA